MAITKATGNVGLTAVTTGTSVSRAFANNVAAGSLLVGFAAVNANETITFGDNNGNSWDPAITLWYADLNTYIAFGYVLSANAGATTVSQSGATSTSRWITVCEYVPGSAVSLITSPVSAFGTGSNPDAGAITSTGPAVFLAGGVVYFNTAPTPGSGYTALDAGQASMSYTQVIEDQIFATGQTNHHPAYSSSKEFWALLGIGFQESGGGGGTVVEKTAEDSVAVSDGSFISRLRGAVATDTLLVTDASGFSREHQVSASDAFDLLDEASLSRMMGRVVGDGIAVQDEMSWHRLLFRLADDALTLIDAITSATSGGTLHEIVATDAILLSDGTLKAVFLDRLAESQIELSDQAQQALQRLRELGDTLLIEDGSIRTVSRYRRLDTALEVWDEAIPALNQHTTYTADVRIVFGAGPSGIVFGSDNSTVFGGYN